MANKTAVQTLIDYMEENYHLTEESRLEFKKALQMEKQQIVDSFNQGYREGFLDAQSVTENEKDVAEYQDAENYYLRLTIK
jgi:predicted secreted protein